MAKREASMSGVTCAGCRRGIVGPVEWRSVPTVPASFATTDPLVPYCRPCAKRVDAKRPRA
jgi:hypothetical protein